MTRNRELMHIFKDLDMVEQLGTGMQRDLAKYARSAFKITPNFLLVTFMFSEPVNELANDVTNEVINDVINEKEKFIFEAIKENNHITKKELSCKAEVFANY